MDKRLLFLENLVLSGKADAFARYGLAMEYKRLGRAEDALKAFSTLRDVDPGYVPQYLMAAQVLLTLGQQGEAKLWLEQGIAVAQKAHNSHAESELRSALLECE
jgi:tetratricopeptide (TPR) repeat protein